MNRQPQTVWSWFYSVCMSVLLQPNDALVYKRWRTTEQKVNSKRHLRIEMSHPHSSGTVPSVSI